jgi:hypothetical protein
MSFYGTKAEAAKYAKEADLQIDGLEPGSTSPLYNGGSGSEGGAPMSGESTFTDARTRKPQIGNKNVSRREFPSEGVSKK